MFCLFWLVKKLNAVSWLSTFSIFEVSLIMNSTSSMVVGEGLVVDSGLHQLQDPLGSNERGHQHFENFVLAGLGLLFGSVGFWILVVDLSLRLVFIGLKGFL